jgi:hypothetical protein
MLELNDPLWQKLDDAHRDRDIAKLLAGLAETWDDETANSLFWDCLCHQETCYGATYAVIPHLLKIADPERNRHQRREIALFLGFVALCALEPRRVPNENQPLPGLPQSLDAWDRKLDCYRSLVAAFEDPRRARSPYERTELLPRYKRILAIEPVNADDLQVIQSIGAEFFSALPTIRALCERTLRENLQEENAARHLLSGIAAADGLLNVARLLDFGREGQFRCSSCDRGYEYILFGDRIAIYADDDAPPTAHRLPAGESRAGESRMLCDFKEHAPSRADGFMVPAGDDAVLDLRAAALLSLADRAASPEPALLLRNFLGSFLCCKCGALGPIRAD